MLDYGFYSGDYKGYVITSSNIFDRYKVKAERYFKKLESIWCISYDCTTVEGEEELKNHAICSIIDNMYEYETRSKGLLKSESNGSYSVTYNPQSSNYLNSRIMEELSYYIVIYRGGL